MCPHNRRRSECKCKECGGSGICGRNKRMAQSQECGGMPSASTVRKSSCAHVRSSRSYVSSQKKHVKLSCKYYRCQLDLCQGSRWLASVVMASRRRAPCRAVGIGVCCDTEAQAHSRPIRDQCSLMLDERDLLAPCEAPRSHHATGLLEVECEG